MARFYGTLDDPGCARGIATKCGYTCMKASAQSYDGSVITKVYYDEDDRLCVRIELDDGSAKSGDLYFKGTFEQLKEKLK